MLRRAVLGTAALVIAARAAGAQVPPRLEHYTDRSLALQWFRPAEERGAWPAPGGSVDAAALDCTALGEGGGRPVRCVPLRLVDEVRASRSRFGQCLALRERRLSPAAVAAYARTGAGPAGTLLFVRWHQHQTEELRGPCRQRGIDACMGQVGPVVGHRVVRSVEHNVLPGAETLRADAFDPVRGSGPWLAPMQGDGPAPPGDGAFDEAPLLARTVPSQPDGARFAAWVDLTVARLHRGAVDDARASLARAVELAPALTGTPFTAPDLSRPRTAADADALADSGDPVEVRHAALRALLGADAFALHGAVAHAAERARDLRTRITPPASASRLFFRGEDPRVFVPTVLGALHRLTRQLWSDPCAPSAP